MIAGLDGEGHAPPRKACTEQSIGTTGHPRLPVLGKPGMHP